MGKEKETSLHEGRVIIERIIWKPENGGDFITGNNLVRHDDGKIGVKENLTYYTITVDGEIVTLPTLSALNNKLASVPINAIDVMIEFIGEEKSGAGMKYKNFIVSYLLPENTDPEF